MQSLSPIGTSYQFVGACPDPHLNTGGVVVKEPERTWGRNGNKLTKVCVKHGKIDCSVCAQTRKWDELLKRVSKKLDEK